MAEENKTVFVSYSHEDKDALDTLMPYLKQLELNEHIELWSDRLIGVGEDWYAEIAEKLDSAKVAVLIITQNFLASRFCKHEEVPVLLQRARRGELAIFPVLFETCFWEDEPWLRRLQMVPEASTPLDQQPHGGKSVLTDLARSIRDVVSGHASPPRHVVKTWPLDAFNLNRLPETGDLLFGRRKELNLLDKAWDDRQTNVLVFKAGGGVGKSTLVRVWCEMLAEDNWRGAERAYAWSFYSQGSGRMTSADLFIDTALRYFGDDPPEGLSPWDKGTRLADFVRKQRTLLVLDGVEPLQSSAKFDRGALQDPALKTMLLSLAKENPGLCLVTTREEMVDLKDRPELPVDHHGLDQISPLSGRALLRSERINGEDNALERAVTSLGCHALAVNLMGTYIAETPARHITTYTDLSPRTLEEESANDVNGHPKRVIRAWARRLGNGPELQLLHLVGLFDRPADKDATGAVVRESIVTGLNEYLRKDLAGPLKRLRDARLLAKVSTHAPGTLDAHPLVREHFGEDLEATNLEAFKEGHRRLYEYLQSVPDKDQPDTLDELAPLYAAVHHGCKAGLHQETLEQVYWARICRGDNYYNIRALGSYGSDLTILAGFFSEPWSTPDESLTEHGGTICQNIVGNCLMALGRLTEAAEPMEAALTASINSKRWEDASSTASNLSLLCLTQGNIDRALKYAEQSSKYADICDVPFARLSSRAAHANALHQDGSLIDAEALFAEAKKIQKKDQPKLPHLYSAQGYFYHDFLLTQRKAKDVFDIALGNVAWAIRSRGLLDTAVERLSLGRALVALAKDRKSQHLIQAQGELNAAVEGLREARAQEFIARGLLARAEYSIFTRSFDKARSDLTETLELAERSGMRLFEADAHLGFARLCLAQDDRTKAQGHLAIAKPMITEMGYHRRDPEVEELERELSLDTDPTTKPH